MGDRKVIQGYEGEVRRSVGEYECEMSRKASVSHLKGFWDRLRPSETALPGLVMVT